MLSDFLIGPQAAVREAIAGRAYGVFNTAGGALYWAALGISALPVALVLPGVVIAVIASGLAFGGGLQLWLQAKRLPAGTWDAARVKRLQWDFRLIGTAEALGVGITVVICGVWAGHWEWLGPAIAIPIGLHFFALARVFRVPVYNVTATALCAVGLVTIRWVPTGALVRGQLAFMAEAPAPLWRLVPGLGAALILWLTCAVMVAGGRELIGRSESGQGDVITQDK